MARSAKRTLIKVVVEWRKKRLTELFQHLVTLVENKVLDLRGVELLVADERHHTTGGADNDVRALLLGGKDFLVGRDRGSTVEDGGADLRHVLRETRELVTDLVREFTGVTEDNNANLAVDRLTDQSATPSHEQTKQSCHSQLLQTGKDEHRRLTHTRLGLTEDIGAKNGLGNALLLDWMSATRVSVRWNKPSDGCSKPRSEMARRISGLSRKSRKPVEWIPT